MRDGKPFLFFLLLSHSSTDLRYIFDKDIRRQNFSDTDYCKKNTKAPIEILISIDISDTEDADSQKLRAKLKGAILSGQEKVYIKVEAKYDEKEMVGVPILYWGGDAEDLEEMKVRGTFTRDSCCHTCFAL